MSAQMGGRPFNGVLTAPTTELLSFWSGDT
jgi:hypothetical protein